jgi:hypothetical protein
MLRAITLCVVLLKVITLCVVRVLVIKLTNAIMNCLSNKINMKKQLFITYYFTKFSAQFD